MDCNKECNGFTKDDIFHFILKNVYTLVSYFSINILNVLLCSPYCFANLYLYNDYCLYYCVNKDIIRSVRK